MHFTNNLKELSEYIPESRIPVELDGADPWEYKYVEAVAGENARMKDTATRDKLVQEREALYEQYEAKTLQYMREADAEKKAAIKVDRNELGNKLKTGYWNLDPYVRARSLYDRIGVLKENGTVDHYPTGKPAPVANGVPVAAASAPAAAATPAAVASSADDVD